MTHAIVTGGGTGVGADTAQRLAKAGYTVTIMGRSEGSLQSQDLPYQVCDVTDRDAVKRAFDAARADNGPIDVVVANAGAAHSVPFAKMTPDDLTAMLDVNLTGVFNVWQEALPDMKAAGGGRMIAIASTAGLKGYPYVSGYCAAKHGVVGLTRALAIELAATGITVNAVCPGFIETPMLDRSIANIVSKTGMTEEDAAKSLTKGNPQRRFIQTDEVAETVLWLCSDAARSVNGHALSISGGEI
ncbi:SDR family NAD(P)-dependent oxidoreductase [Yoonia sp. SDW83-1]|uniref:SDR family NAD(P)-dependent oxidoreductase n=1 Tax=Yoonia sp. SDW83-1 TaxID=3366945 RepID=UPI00398C31D0